MKLKGSTWFLLFLAFSLGGWVYFYEIKATERISQIEAKQQQIFQLAESEIQKITIAKSNNTLEFVRTGDKNQPWQMKQPEDVPASDATISFLLNLIVNGKSDRSLTIPLADLSKYGLDQSATKITIELKNKKSHEISLGNTNFSDRSVYAQVASANNTQITTTQEIPVMLVPKNWYYAVDRDLSEWKQTP